ncbi:MAG: hypothetical protein ACXVQR_02050 [Solirubrobacteraceae bacterium]
MAAKHKVKVSTDPTNRRLTSSERREARLAEISGKQGELKREAAERRAQRASRDGVPAATATAKRREAK